LSARRLAANVGRSSYGEIIRHDQKAKKRANNPPVSLVDAKSDDAEGKKTYADDPHLDPTLVWAGKHGRVAVKIVDDRGIESLKLLEII
jgi:hypothetical protein